MSSKFQTVLPKTIDDFRASFGVKTDNDVVSLIRNPKNFSQSQAAIWKYSGAALFGGRPLDSTIVMMAGATGAGKSSTINSLFNDRKLCETSSTTSATSKIKLIRKSLEITKEKPEILTNLTFVDVPGLFDTNAEIEQKNREMIRRFKASCKELKDRAEIPWAFRTYFQISPIVYPNMVLFVVNAEDNRMDGPNSIFMESLRALKDLGKLIDFKQSNLIVVLTHVMTLTRKHFEKRLQEKKKIIQKGVFGVLGIADVEIIPVENEPEDYDLPKDGDYFQLPNGDYTPLNLYRAMKRCFKKDLLAQLSVGWYYHTGCPDRNKRAEVIEANIEISAEDLQKLEKMVITRSRISTVDLKNMSNPCLLYNMQSLSYGYCPVTEHIKAAPLEKTKEQKTVTLGKSQFQVPTGMSVYSNPVSNFHRLSFLKKQQYEQHKQHSYGLDVGYKLVVSANLEGKWIDQGDCSDSQQWISVLYETQVATLRLDDPSGQQKSEKFQKAVENLPEEYNRSTENAYQAFFSRWGTHLIHELGLGGSVQLKCLMSQKNMTAERLNEVEVKVSGVFKQCFSVGAGYSFSQDAKKLRDIGVVEESLRFTGGDPPPLINLDSLNSATLQTWARSVAQRPSELLHTIKLYPYYHLIGGKRSESLREATVDFIKNSERGRIENELNQNKNADKSMDEVVQSNPPQGPDCFPKGARVYLVDGSVEAIENLFNPSSNTNMATFSVKGTFGKKIKICETSQTKLCTYLDAKPEQVTEYIGLHFSNGKNLFVSPGHMIFEYLPEKDSVVGKQAKHFRVGDRAVYTNLGKGDALVEYPIVIKVSRETCTGAYAPLTTSGTLIVDGFFVSCYANIDSFLLGQIALVPLKVYRTLVPQNTLTGDSTKTGIHPYAKCLISLRNTLQFFKKVKDQNSS